jgi:hypothetical protein
VHELLCFGIVNARCDAMTLIACTDCLKSV